MPRILLHCKIIYFATAKDIFLEEFKSGDRLSKKCGLSLQRMIADVKTFPEKPAGNEIFIVSQKVSQIIQETTEQIGGILYVCQVYAQRYLGEHVEDQFRGTSQSIRNLIPELLALFLKFFYLASKHLDKNAFERILRSSFKSECKELKDIAHEARMKVQKLYDIAQIDFEDTVLDILRQLGKNPQDVRRLEKFVKNAAKSIGDQLVSIQSGIEKIQTRQDVEEIKSSFSGNLEWFQKGHILDLTHPVNQYLENISKDRYHEKSCEWIWTESEFKDWAKQDHGVLCISGKGGVGKSVLVSTIISGFTNNLSQAKLKSEKKPLLLTFFCRYGEANTTDSSKILLHLCAQLFHKADDKANGDGSEQLVLKKECNEAVEAAKAKLKEPEKMRPDSMATLALKSLFSNLQKVFGRPVVITIDALNECSDEQRFLTTLESLQVHVLVSSRSLLRTKCIVVDEEKATKHISLYVSDTLTRLELLWETEELEDAVEDIIKYAKGTFKYASSVMEILRRPESAFLTYEAFKHDLPVEGCDLYVRQVKELSEPHRRILITALRWLVCAGETVDIVLVADELSKTFTMDARKHTSDNKETPRALQIYSKSFLDIGRDMLKVTGTTLQLEHGSVRDFVLSGKDAYFAQAGGAEGHLRMAQHLIRTLNSPAFQKRYLSDEAIKRRKTKSSAGKTEPLRYELVHWPKHVRCADVELKQMERHDLVPEWVTLLDEIKRFMDPENKVFACWLKLKSTAEEDRTKDTALHTASRYGIPSLIESLLNDKDLGIKNQNDDTPLHLVCRGEGNFLGMDHLLSPSVVNKTNKNGETPIFIACKNARDNLGPIEKLLEHGADPTIPDKSKATCLHSAAASRNIKLCRLLLADGVKNKSKVDADAGDSMGETPLHLACKLTEGSLGVIRLLLQHGANVNAQDAESQAPLYEACTAGCGEAVELLLGQKADVNDDDVNGQTALHAAIHAGSLPIVKQLLDHNNNQLVYNLREKLKDDKKASRRLDAYRTLVEKEAKEVNAVNLLAKNLNKQEALTYAAFRKEFEIMEYLLSVHQDRGSNLDFLLETDRDHMTPLQYCIKHGACSSVQQLLDLRKSVTGQNSDTQGKNAQIELVKKMCEVPSTAGGNQALHTAARQGNLQIVKLLLDSGASVNARTNVSYVYGRTPIDVAFVGWQRCVDIKNKQSLMFEDIIVELSHHVQHQISGWALKLNCASERGSTKVFQLFEKWHSKKDEYGWTPTMVAAQSKFNVAQDHNSTQPTNSGTQPPTRWSSKDKDARLKVSEDGLLVSFTARDVSKLTQMSIRADNPVQPEQKKFYFEVSLEKSKSNKPYVDLQLFIQIKAHANGIL
ncbi:hypothetical protein SLS56_005879 [Neofusicoccum ribis]|uniref:Nephrocystin 3-like N-terminal domain-containing protein n=1 Tax=Neofusicoccum ribis TaxID=45134 RepID=A0ABR3SSF2_9PEZI